MKSQHSKVDKMSIEIWLFWTNIFCFRMSNKNSLFGQPVSAWNVGDEQIDDGWKIDQ